MSDYDLADARVQRLERQRAAQLARRRRTASVILAVATLAALAVAAPRVVAAVSREIDRRTVKPAAIALPSSVPATVNVAPVVFASQVHTLTVIAVGDLLFDSGPRRLIAAQGGRAPLAKVEAILADADVTIGNLEGPLSNRGVDVASKPTTLTFEGDPRAVEGLSASGFDLVALANNHIMDFGSDALVDTFTTLDSAKIGHAGAGMNTAEAWKPAIIERQGKRIAFLSFSQVVPAYFLPSDSRPGLANGKEMSKCLAAIREARTQADFVIVSYHWGTELDYTANANQVRDARASIDAGADMVLSHHPHVMQELEFYKGRLIVYSLGNFVFPFKSTEGRRSFILKAEMGPGGTGAVRITPVYLGEYGVPSVQTGSSAAGILGKLREISAGRGTQVIVEGDTAAARPQ